MNRFLLYAISLIVLFPIWVVLHEAAHVAGVYITGGTVILFSCFPEVIHGEIFLGRTVFKGGDTTIIVIAPYVADSFIFYFGRKVANHIRDSSVFPFMVAVLTCPIINTGMALFTDPSDFSEVHRIWSMMFLTVLYVYVLFLKELIQSGGSNGRDS